MAKICVHLFVSGKVQGVYFRDSTKKIADELGISGWVSNLADGRVEAVFEGEESAINKAIEFVRQGPRRAKVRDVQIKFLEYSDKHSGFLIK